MLFSLLVIISSVFPLNAVTTMPIAIVFMNDEGEAVKAVVEDMVIEEHENALNIQDDCTITGVFFMYKQFLVFLFLMPVIEAGDHKMPPNIFMPGVGPAHFINPPTPFEAQQSIADAQRNIHNYALQNGLCDSPWQAVGKSAAAILLMIGGYTVNYLKNRAITVVQQQVTQVVDKTITDQLSPLSEPRAAEAPEEAAPVENDQAQEALTAVNELSLTQLHLLAASEEAAGGSSTYFRQKYQDALNGKE